MARNQTPATMVLRSVIFSLLFSIRLFHTQAQSEEAVIRELENKEVQAILSKDSTTLLNLWDENYTVNSPDNHIYSAGETTLDRPVLKRARSSFTRSIERIIIRDNIAVSMGSETVTPAAGDRQAVHEVKRRYSNVWMKQGSGWKLIARHANVVCVNNP